MNVTYYGHSSFLFEIEGSKVLFDPFISPNPLASAIDVAKIEADYLLLSHGHGDHVADAEAIGQRTGAEVVAIAEIAGWFGNKGLKAAYPMNIGGKVKLPFGTVKMVAAAHSSSLPDGSYGGIAAGFVVEAEGKTFYFAGDTALTYDMKLIGEQYKLDFALLPIGDNYTMGIDDALIAADWVGASKIIGMHYDTFPAIAIDQEATKEKAQLAGKELVLLTIGETISL
ncbi:metal-dependent hydrolase [Hymenobacter sp. GOD-10R]|uniref:metal-dependent hydrolase n=1 Tax=Hymenobacter sp. GOD-10R TaxID=3093922 RepID=UPI002D778C12|nr:metal-dependent hydrolase [Hymenobacter sp. GOD-10R]WRQ29885.1 metal-dependent hydrolase [Hymenobacter sp. GOD-10R]